MFEVEGNSSTEHAEKYMDINHIYSTLFGALVVKKTLLLTFELFWIIATSLKDSFKLNIYSVDIKWLQIMKLNHFESHLKSNH